MEGGVFMALRIMNNVTATYAQRMLGISTGALSRSLERLSSGYRINHASDDAAGLAVSEKLRFQIRGLEQAQRNVQDGISLIQVAEGGIQETTDILQRIRVLSIQASNGTLANSDRNLIAEEVNQLISEIDRMQSTVTFNGVSLLSTASTATGGSISLQVGASASQTLSVTLSKITSTVLSLNTLAVTSSAKAESAVLQLDSALSSILSLRAKLGASQNRLEKTYDFLGIQRENLMASESRIRDVDFASEMTQYTNNQILVQASTAMLSQANVSIQSVLQLLG
jgi:flagellin